MSLYIGKQSITCKLDAANSKQQSAQSDDEWCNPTTGFKMGELPGLAEAAENMELAGA